LGADWIGTSKELKDVDLSKSAAHGVVTEGVVKMELPYRKDNFYWQPVTWIAVLKDGSPTWSGHPGYPKGPYVAYTKENRPATLWGVGQEIVAPDDKVKFWFHTQE
jgi:hypothetical protein